MFNLFKKDANSRPEGEIATTIIDICTNPAAPEVDYPAVFTTIELIKGYYQTGTPLEGCVQAIKAIRYRLEAADPVTLNYTLTVLDTFYKNCEKPFVSQMSSKDNLKALETFLARRDLAPENRGQCLEMIANWARATEDPPEIRAFFETLLQSGYRFSAASLARLPPGAYERIMRGKPTTGFMGSRSHSQGVQPVQTAPVPPLPSKDVNAPLYVPQLQSQPHMQARQQQQPQQQPRRQSPEIFEVSLQDRQKWIAFDLSVAESCTTMLLETIAVENQNNDGHDISENEIAREGFFRCCDIQCRIVALIPKVREPLLVEKLLSANMLLNNAIEQYNSARLAFWKRKEEFEFEMSGFSREYGSPIDETRAVPGPPGSDSTAEIVPSMQNLDVKGKGKGKLVESSETQSTPDDFEQLPGPSGTRL